MHNLLSAIVIGSAFGAAVVVDEKMLVPVGTMIAVGSLLFWSGRKWQSMSDRLNQVINKVNNLPCVKGRCEVKQKDDLGE